MKHFYMLCCLVILTVLISGCGGADCADAKANASSPNNIIRPQYDIRSLSAASQKNIIRTQNAYSVCTKPDMDWINFCNGLMQGYADYVLLTGQACIPPAVTKTQLVTLFTGKLIKITESYKNDRPALEGAVEVFALAYPCTSG